MSDIVITVRGMDTDLAPADTDLFPKIKASPDTEPYKESRLSLRSGLAPSTAPFVTTAADAGLSNEQLLSALVGRGAVSGRPAASIAGRLWQATDAGSRRLTRDTGAAWEDMGLAGAVFDVREYGDIYTGADISAVIQAALDAAETAGGGIVKMPALGGQFKAVNLEIGSFVTFDGGDCDFVAPAAATGYFMANKSVNDKGYQICNVKFNALGSATYGIDLNHDGGTYGSEYADPEPRLYNIRISNSAVISFRFTGVRVIRARLLRSRASTGHGFSLLPGAGGPGDPDQTNDCVFLQCSASSSGADCLHIETSSNSVIGWKGGEASAGRGVYMGSGCTNTYFQGIVDNSDFNVYLDGASRNIIDVVTQQGSAANPSLTLTASADQNIIRLVAWASNATATYAALIASGCNGNQITVNSIGMATADLDPASDLAANYVILNGKLKGWDGTAAPTPVGVVNVAAVSSRSEHWFRIGDEVHVAGACDIDPTAGSTRTVFRVPLPVASNLSLVWHLAGTCGYTTGSTQVFGIVQVDATNDAAQFEYTSDAGGALQMFSYHYTYRVF